MKLFLVGVKHSHRAYNHQNLPPFTRRHITVYQILLGPSVWHFMDKHMSCAWVERSTSPRENVPDGTATVNPVARRSEGSPLPNCAPAEDDSKVSSRHFNDRLSLARSVIGFRLKIHAAWPGGDNIETRTIIFWSLLTATKILYWLAYWSFILSEAFQAHLINFMFSRR
jgi:hypothetical protein